MKFCPASDQALLVYLGDRIGLAAHERVLALLRSLQHDPPSWLRNLQPAYCSLTVTFDACRVNHARVETLLRKHAKRLKKARKRKPRLVEIPVCYGSDFGPDLVEVAQMCELTAEKVVELHASRTYHAYFLGFAPGFAYLGNISKRIAVPRLETPRERVAPGSVAIAGRQTAVYPFATPGGWRLIGRTPQQVFRSDRQPMELINIGDRVKFQPISREEFRVLETA